jgi:hypothetical protein
VDNTTILIVLAGAGVAYYLYTQQNTDTNKPDMTTAVSPPLSVTGTTNFYQRTSTGQTTTTSPGFGKPISDPIVVAVPPDVSKKSAPQIIPGAIGKVFNPVFRPLHSLTCVSGSIYLIKSTEGDDVYVGYTAQELQQRLFQHALEWSKRKILTK